MQQGKEVFTWLSRKQPCGSAAKPKSSRPRRNCRYHQYLWFLFIYRGLIVALTILGSTAFF